MPRFYCNLPLSTGAIIQLPEAVARHVHVLRLAVNDPIILFNGSGGQYNARLVAIEKKHVQAKLHLFDPCEAEPAYGITLAQALPEGAKMDWIVEKAVELGAAGIQPLAASRSVVRLSAERAAKKMEHWQGVMAAAAEQCGRNRLPHLAELADFIPWMRQQDMHRRILLSPRGTQSLADWARHQPAQALTLIIGPEGGLTDAEENLAIAEGAVCVAMGARILRTETAGLAALAAIHALWGEL